MAKISFFEVAQVLVEHKGLEKGIAKEFVKTMFDIILERLTTDQLVKVRGLGTFKVVGVDSRESVNVTTGERFVIEGHSKITFTPDSTMKELINKPFSQFETVMLNDGVNFADNKAEEKAGEEPAPVVEEEPAPVIEEEPAPVVEEEPTPVVEEKPAPEIVEEEPAPETVEEEPAPETVEEEPALVVEEEPAPVVEEEPAPVVEEEPEESRLPSHFKPVLIHLIYITVVAALAGWGGYWYGKNSAEQETAAKVTMPAKPRKAVTVRKTVAAKPAVKPDTTRKDTAKPVVQEKQDEVKTEAQIILENHEKYSAMDSRVRTGAYVIVGELRTEKVRKGETMERFARRMLGEGMECYIEVFNSIPPKTPLKEGQEIKIPKLRLKKAVRKQSK